MASVGTAVPRKEGRDKVTGRARYVDDLVFPGMIHGVTVRSAVARGKIRAIHYEGNIPWEEFTIVTAADVPGKNYVALIEHDQPYLADTMINHAEEAIVLLAHPDKYLLEEARKHVHVDVEPMPAVFTIEDALAKKHVIWGADNIFKTYLVDKGNVDDAFKRTDVIVVEGEYLTGAQEQLYIETNGMIAIANREEGVTVWGSMQCPYYVHKALVPLFGVPDDKVRVIQSETGGGFGGKEEYPSMLAGHAALLAWKSGKPVKMIYDRAEDIAATTKRHPSRTRQRVAVQKDGKIVGMEIDFVIDGGAYATLSAVVLSRGTIHAAGPYSIPNVRVHAKAVATSTPPQGAFRGFGAPQSIFALERHLNKVARAVGLSPEELRRRNYVREGLKTATGQVIHEKIDVAALTDRALNAAGYFEKRKQFFEENKRPGATRKKGMGFATFMHGSGFTGSGEKRLASMVALEGTSDGLARVLAASTEIGQGTNTIFAQIAADALGVDYDSVAVLRPDTRFVPNSGPTVASRTVMVVGKLVESAAVGMRQTLQQCGLLATKYTSTEFRQAVREYLKKHGALKCFAQYKQPPNIEWDDAKYQGDAYGAYAWACYVAEVSVDTVTYEARVENFVALQEVGKVIHPLLAAGQIEGGVAQGIGYALYENCVWKDGRMINGQMTNYIMPTSVDLPPIHALFEELPYEHGPQGAKGIGELPMDGPAPAILNAIEEAIGKAVDEIPLLPEKLMRAMEKSP